MKRIRIAVRALVVGLAIAMPVSADAPISGPDQQYEVFDANDRVIRDLFTDLVWERPSAPYPSKKTFAEASTYCATASMRLPSLKELLTLVDEDPHDEYDLEKKQNVSRYIDQRAFGKTPAEEFWTSSLQDDDKAWTVHFGKGTTESANLTDQRRVRCVDYAPQ
jgi:hypothetical protein